MYQQNLMRYGPNSMFVCENKNSQSAHKQLITDKQSLNPFQKQSSISPQSTLQRTDRHSSKSPSNFQKQLTNRQSPSPNDQQMLMHSSISPSNFQKDRLTNSLPKDRQTLTRSSISPSNFQKDRQLSNPYQLNSSSLTTNITTRQLTDRQTQQTSVTPTPSDSRWLDIGSPNSYARLVIFLCRYILSL